MTITDRTTATKGVPMDSLRKTALVAGVFYVITFAHHALAVLPHRHRLSQHRRTTRQGPVPLPPGRSTPRPLTQARRWLRSLKSNPISPTYRPSHLDRCLPIRKPWASSARGLWKPPSSLRAW